MKKIFTIVALVVLGFVSTTSFAQVSTTATVSSTIITPISISKIIDMDFGTASVSTSPGTIQLGTDNTRVKSGGVTLPVVTGTVTSAKFTVTGQGNSTYSITLPSTVTTIDDNNGHTMTVDGWISDPSATGLLTSGGSQDVFVGATLHVSGSQPAGVYLSDIPFSVTVNYN